MDYTNEMAYVEYQLEEGIATLEFFHPKSNSFPSHQLNKMIETFHKLGDNPKVKVIVLRSRGEKVFCAGASFDELLTLKNKEVGTTFFMGFARLILAMRDCPKFIIGCIEGKVVGGGVGLLAACDYALALDNAKIRLSELSIGIGPFVIEPAISRKIGANSFSELTLNPKEWVGTDWTKEKGLYNEVFSNREHLHSACTEFAQQLADYSPEAMRMLKTILWKEAKDWDEIMPKRAAMSGELALSDFTKNTLNKFKNKK